MARFTETALGTILIAGAGLAHFGLLDDAVRLVMPQQQEQSTQSNNPWSKNYVAAPSRPTIHYRNCAEARSAGAAPVRLGDPGYGTHLDRDRDGIGCEPYY